MLKSTFQRLKQGLRKTRTQFSNSLSRVFTGSVPLTDDLLESIEETLIASDIGVDLALELIENLRKNFPLNQVVEMQNVLDFLRHDLVQRLDAHPAATMGAQRPYVILVVGVNGTGKTTSIGKLASLYSEAGHKVMLVAGDTFRAAAIEQLQVWADRSKADLIRNDKAQDPASVVFDALQAAKSRSVDVVIIDTAGRLHTQKNLMEELAKVRRVVQKVVPDGPHETLLTIDATTGQNGLIQAEQFSQAAPVDHLFLTKLDGTAKGGIALAINQKMHIPVKYIGLGEQLGDIQNFSAEDYVRALFETVQESNQN